jgi:hypothetical protein
MKVLGCVCKSELHCGVDDCTSSALKKSLSDSLFTKDAAVCAE